MEGAYACHHTTRGVMTLANCSYIPRSSGRLSIQFSEAWKSESKESLAMPSGSFSSLFLVTSNTVRLYNSHIVLTEGEGIIQEQHSQQCSTCYSTRNRHDALQRSWYHVHKVNIATHLYIYMYIKTKLRLVITTKGSLRMRPKFSHKTVKGPISKCQICN